MDLIREISLTFSKKRVALTVKKCLQSAISNAENNHNLDVDELIVAHAYVGKNMVLKRGRKKIIMNCHHVIIIQKFTMEI